MNSGSKIITKVLFLPVTTQVQTKIHWTKILPNLESKIRPLSVLGPFSQDECCVLFGVNELHDMD